MQHWFDSRYLIGKYIPDILILLLQELKDRHLGSQAARAQKTASLKTTPRDLTGIYRKSACQVLCASPNS